MNAGVSAPIRPVSGPARSGDGGVLTIDSTDSFLHRLGGSTGRRMMAGTADRDVALCPFGPLVATRSSGPAWGVTR